MTIANFSKRDINGETGIPLETHFIVYLDAVSVTPVNPDEKLCGDWERAKMAIYQVDDRHEFLERYVRFYRSQGKLADPPKLSLTQIHKTEKILLKDEWFVPARSILEQKGYAVLDSFCNRLLNRSIDSAAIGCYIGDEGDLLAADEIGLQRASMVKEYLRRKLVISEKKITILAAQQAAAPNKNTTGGQSRKRRIEILLAVHE
jgi:outer membrane protein OmpA-like peptidoglycan-associated protein